MILSIVGARPQFIKAAAVSRALKQAHIVESIVHSGQHYDDAMSGRFLRDLGIDNIIANLDCRSGSHAAQTARMMVGIEEWILRLKSELKAVLVYGDTNSSIAAALAASKLDIPIVHVEAGLRSFNRAMPEEVNRVVVDHLSAIHFCSSQEGVTQLAREGIDASVHDVGDVMLDAFRLFSPEAQKIAGSITLPFDIQQPFLLVTIHRPSNTDNSDRLAEIVGALASCEMPCLWPVHPRLKTTISEMKLPSNIFLIDPLAYFEMLVLIGKCHRIVTDSGGLQKEAYWGKRPCITVRNETEWVETLHGGWNQLCESPRASLLEMVSKSPTTPWQPLYGDGQASQRIAAVLKTELMS